MKTNHIDGWLYVGLGIWATAILILDTTDAAKYIPQPNLFYLKFYISIMNAAFVAAKAYRSTNFSKSQDEKAAAQRDVASNNPYADRTNQRAAGPNDNEPPKPN